MKIIKGVVKKISNPNTVIVEVERLVPHKIYGKVMRRTTNYKADFQGEGLKIGDKVRIVEVRPISKDKHFKVYNLSKLEEKTLKKGKK